jgi:hypothetical protein
VFRPLEIHRIIPLFFSHSQSDQMLSDCRRRPIRKRHNLCFLQLLCAAHPVSKGNYLVITDQIEAETISKDCSLWHRALISSFIAISQRSLSIKQSRARWPSHEKCFKLCLIHLTDNYIELLAFVLHSCDRSLHFDALQLSMFNLSSMDYNNRY